MLYEKMQAYFTSVNLKHISVQIVVHLYVVFVVNGKINIRIILADIEVFSWIRIRDSTKTLKNYLAAFERKVAQMWSSILIQPDL